MLCWPKGGPNTLEWQRNVITCRTRVSWIRGLVTLAQLQCDVYLYSIFYVTVDMPFRRSGVLVCMHACASVANRWHSDDEFDIMLEFRIAGRRGCCHSSCRLITRKMIHFLLQNRIVEESGCRDRIECFSTSKDDFQRIFFYFFSFLVACCLCTVWFACCQP